MLQNRLRVTCIPMFRHTCTLHASIYRFCRGFHVTAKSKQTQNLTLNVWSQVIIVVFLRFRCYVVDCREHVQSASRRLSWSTCLTWCVSWTPRETLQWGFPCFSGALSIEEQFSHDCYLMDSLAASQYNVDDMFTTSAKLLPPDIVRHLEAKQGER